MVVRNLDHQLTIFLKNRNIDFSLYTIIVHAKFEKIKLLELLDEIYQVVSEMIYSWLTGEDLNMVCNREKMIGDLLVVDVLKDFKTCMESNELTQVQLKWSPFIRWNVKEGKENIF